MKLLCVSDSHGDLPMLIEAVEQHQGEFDLLVHLGDGLRELEELREIYPKLEYAWVRGNCDGHSSCVETRSFICRGVKVLLTHGHLFGVKRSLVELERYGRETESDLVLFGHTHQPFAENRNGLWLVNPGSIGRGRSQKSTCALIEIRDGRVADVQLLEVP